jgi:hypothetical protein
MYWIIAALAIAGWVAVLISSRSALQQTCAELRLEFQRQIDSLATKIGALEQAAAARTAGAHVSAVAASGKMESSAGNAVSPAAAQTQATEEITPETLATITETVSALLGRKVHVRSVKVLPALEATVNPWAQGGRAIIQASRDFSQRSRP